MYTVKCTSCGFGNVIDEEVCIKCGGSLFEANLSHHTEHLRNTVATLNQSAYPSFYTFNGCGTTLLDYRELGDGLWTATRWVTVIYWPVIPLREYVIKPLRSQSSSNALRFQIVRREWPSPVRIAFNYLLEIAGIAPLVLGFEYQRWVNRTLGGTLAFVAMLVCFAWAVFVWSRFMNADRKFKKSILA